MSTTPLVKKKWKSEDIQDQTGKVFIITGANSGLGLEASFRLAEKNAEIIMACRNLEKGNEAASLIKAQIPDVTVEVMELDLSSLESVEHFAKAFLAKYKKLDGLLNNAGVMQPPKSKSAEGYELQFAVNHLGHFKLTALLFDVLKSTTGSRVINQSSIAHKGGKINFDDINSENKYSRFGAYGQSKIANLYFTYEMARRSSEQVLSIAVHPGYTNTNLQQAGPKVDGASFWSRAYAITDKFAMDVSIGTLPMLYAATQDDITSGDFIGPAGFMGARGYPKRIKSNKRSYDIEIGKKLWELSEEMTGTKFLS